MDCSRGKKSGKHCKNKITGEQYFRGSHLLALCLHDFRITHAWTGSSCRAQWNAFNDTSNNKIGRAEDEVRILVALYEMPAGRVQKADVRATCRQRIRTP